MQDLGSTAQVLTLVAGIGAPVLAAGGAFLAVKYGLNGAKDDIKEIKDDVKLLKDCWHKTEVCITEVKTELRDTRSWVGAMEHRIERYIEDAL